ncbi:MAG: HAMP domain-containing sensor histidine kinase, partial [Bdellovibrio sp.]
EIVESAESIVRETRGARQVLDKLLGYAGEEVREKNTMKLEGPVVKALKEMEPLFTQKGVKIVKNFQETTALPLHVEALLRAFTHILQNSVEAMERMVKKEITVDLYEDEHGVHLNIADVGEGIESSQMDKIFDPFFTARSFQNHMGLGLSVAYGILKEHQAELRVESQRGQGTKMFVTFKKPSQESVLPAPMAAPVAPSRESVEDVFVMQDVPRLALRVDSEPAPTAEEEAPVQEAASTSPLDVNIENLLEFPDNDATDPSIKVQEDQVQGLDEKTVVIENQLQAREGAVSDEPAEEWGAPAIAPPKGLKPQKTSRTEAFHVEIRRPEKRG